MQVFEIPIWKAAPFLRLFLSLAAGIIFQYYAQLPVTYSGFILPVLIFFLLIFNSLKLYSRFRVVFITGILINLLFAALGSLLVYTKDIRNDNIWIGHLHSTYESLLVIPIEPVSEKAKTFTCVAQIQSLARNGKNYRAKGNIIVYFEKGRSTKNISFHSEIRIFKPLQPIRNTGNPGSFDYNRYCALQGIYHQVFLKEQDFIIEKNKRKDLLKTFLFQTRTKVVSILHKYIPGHREAGLAEALLIGYKDDLDKTLIQSYSNTGVVHVIAISGLHLGLIYWLLTLLMKPFARIKVYRAMKPLVVIIGLWTFSLLAGGSPSVLRSAVMFSCIIIGESLGKKTSIYNSLAASAFLLLCINPFWLWDAGFQLSYIAVLSLVIYMQPVYHFIYIKNKLLDLIWKLSSVTIAAQILTTPVSLYLFHQFPVYFLLTNLVAIPLSSLILLGELLLCALFFLPTFAGFLGWVLGILIRVMNDFIALMETLPGATIGMILLNFTQVICLFLIICFLSFWGMRKNKNAAVFAMAFALIFMALRAHSFYEASKQEKLIVYNLKGSAFEYVNGRKSVLITGKSVSFISFEKNIFKPAAIINRTRVSNFFCFDTGNFILQSSHIKIPCINTRISPVTPSKEIYPLVILSNNAQVSIKKTVEFFGTREIVIDGSNSLKKIATWKQECADLGLVCWPVNEKGAFILKLN